MMRLLFGPVALLALGFPAAAGARIPAAAQLDYRAVVESYQLGTAASIDRIADAPARDLDAWVDGAVGDRSGTWDWQAIRAAAVLHTELWYRALIEKRDTHVHHLHAAVRLFERLRGIEPRQGDFIERWRQVVAAVLPRLDNAVAAGNFIARTAQSLPLDPRRQLAARAFAAGLDAERGGAEEGEPHRPLMGHDSSMRWWAAAVSAYSDAVKRDPTFDLARLHLGRVRMLQGRVNDAVLHFERASGAEDPRVRYLALLFLGSVAERQARYEDARRAYLNALQAYPIGQAAPIALSQLLSRTGREADAREVLARFSTRKGGFVEPLWTYLPPPDPGPFDQQMLLDELRVEVLR